MESHTQACRAAGEPIIRVDTQHTARLGDFQNADQAWRQEAKVGNVQAFLAEVLGRGVPYGSYTVQRHEGAVSVG